MENRKDYDVVAGAMKTIESTEMFIESRPLEGKDDKEGEEEGEEQEEEKTTENDHLYTFLFYKNIIFWASLQCFHILSSFKA